MKPLILSNKPLIRAFNCDCMDFMKGVPKNHYGLSICDPPYGLGDRLTRGGGKNGWSKRTNSSADKWDIVPGKEYFNSLFEVSKNQIICGGNFFELPPCRQPICWDKKRDHDIYSSHWEYIWTSFVGRSLMFRKSNNGGFVQKEPKIHPTQKTVSLYLWFLNNFAQSGQTILDTHGGSFSSAIACWKMGFGLDICELDKDYFREACERFKRETRQQNMFR